jgi:hypothetical protein
MAEWPTLSKKSKGERVGYHTTPALLSGQGLATRPVSLHGTF